MTQKKKIVLASILGAAVLAAGILGAALWSLFSSRAAVDLPPGELAYRGDHIGFTESEIREKAEQLFCCKTKTTYWGDAIHALSRRETLAYRARAAGLTVTDREAEERAAEERRTLEADLNYAAMIQALAGPKGMTEEEYWSALPKERAYRQELLMEKFIARLKEEFTQKTGGDESQWNSYLEEYEKTAVEEEHLRQVS